MAVTSISGGGKTVFITSLISHLSEFTPSKFDIGKGVEISNFRTIINKKQWPPEFKYEKYRNAIAKKNWPEKSTDCSLYTCEFSRSDWRLKKHKLSLFDFPGERIADAAIAAFKDYGEWSDHILTHFAEHHDYAESSKPYLNYMKKGNISNSVIMIYKEMQANLILLYKPLVSPSTFLVDQSGSVAMPWSAPEIAAARYSGISYVEQFAPLSREARENYPELAERMAKHYSTYRNKVALPVFDNISQATNLIVLIDIPSLLAGGVGRFNDNCQILIDLFKVLEPGDFLGSTISKYFKILIGKALRNVSFVATKTDTIHPVDLANGRVITLLRMMTERTRRVLPDVKYEWFVCSACHSTFPVYGVRRLRGRVTYDNPEKKLKEFDVPEVPESWPNNWEYGDYPFYKVYPDAPENYLNPPKQYGLDKIFCFISS